MISIDTDVLVRILVDDKKNASQNFAARSVAAKYKQLYITQIVQAEFHCVLMKCYHFPKEDIALALTELITNEAFVIENQKIFEQALHQYKTHPIDFGKLLMLSTSKLAGAKFVISFDPEFTKLPGVKSALHTTPK
jgi:predicted nucleic-acid-binding protein